MTEHRTGSSTVDGRQPAALRREALMTHRVHTAMDHAQAPNLDAVGDRVLREPQAQQLLAGDDSVMAPRKRCDQVIDRTLSTWTATIAVYVERVGHGAEHPPGRVTALCRALRHAEAEAPQALLLDAVADLLVVVHDAVEDAAAEAGLEVHAEAHGLALAVRAALHLPE